jgi:hypothetical protein
MSELVKSNSGFWKGFLAGIPGVIVYLHYLRDPRNGWF